jgi:hypothetical protein
MWDLGIKISGKAVQGGSSTSLAVNLPLRLHFARDGVAEDGRNIVGGFSCRDGSQLGHGTFFQLSRAFMSMDFGVTLSQSAVFATAKIRMLFTPLICILAVNMMFNWHVKRNTLQKNCKLLHRNFGQLVPSWGPQSG